MLNNGLSLVEILLVEFIEITFQESAYALRLKVFKAIF
jgi:hypothetical protein